MLMTLYGTGARRNEVAHLKVGDIDSRQMVVHIHGGKSNRDRDVILSRKLLDALRDYRRGLRRSRTDDLGESRMLRGVGKANQRSDAWVPLDEVADASDYRRFELSDL